MRRTTPTLAQALIAGLRHGEPADWVERFERIHSATRRGEPLGLDDLGFPPLPATPPSPAIALLEQLRVAADDDALIEYLAALHTGTLESSAPSDSSSEAARLPRKSAAGGIDRALPEHRDQTLFDRARHYFAAREQDLRRQASITADLIAQMRARDGARPDAATSVPQQLVHLRTSPGHVAGGAFVVENGHAESAAVTYDCSQLVDRATGKRWIPEVSFRPDVTLLAAGRECTVHVRIDLASAPFRAGDEILGTIDVLIDGHVAASLWLEISLVEPVP